MATNKYAIWTVGLYITFIKNRTSASTPIEAKQKKINKNYNERNVQTFSGIQFRNGVQ